MKMCIIMWKDTILYGFYETVHTEQEHGCLYVLIIMT